MSGTAKVIAAFLLLLSANSLAYVKDYLPLNDTELSLRFPQHVLRRNFVPGMHVRFGSTTISFLESTDEIQFSGVDYSGKPWTVTTFGSPIEGGLYSADLDHNGTVDLIYASDTGGVGLAPRMTVLTILFDKTGRPVPSEMDGYFEIDDHGLKDLVDLDQDGRAELIRQAFDDGYWITSLYEARDAHWRLIKGQYASRTFPLYTRFTKRPNRIPTTPHASRHPIEDDLSNDATSYSGTLTAIHWADIQESKDPELDLSDGTVCKPVAGDSTMFVVLDGPDGRTVASLGVSEVAHALLETILKSKLTVQFKGKRRYAVTGPVSCVPETVWASRSASAR